MTRPWPWPGRRAQVLPFQEGVAEMSISQALVNTIKDELKAKTFTSGSKGFYATGKVSDDGVRYQAQAQAVLIGSKGHPKVKVKAGVEEAKAALSAFLEEEGGLTPKTFSTGKTGYYGNGKAEIGGQRYVVQAQAVRLP